MKILYPKQELKHIIYLDAKNLYGYAMYKFLPTSIFKGINPEQFDLNKYGINSCVLEVDLEYPKELFELHIDYPLVTDKIEIKKDMLSNYQLKVADFLNIPIINVTKLVLKLFDKEKHAINYEKLLATLLKARTKAKKMHRFLEFNQSQWLKLYVEFNTHKRRTDAAKKK